MFTDGFTEAERQEIIFIAVHGMEPERLVRRARVTPVLCYGCNRLELAAAMDASTQLCAECYDAAGWENEHNDTNGHDGQFVVDCPSCQNEREGVGS